MPKPYLKATSDGQIIEVAMDVVLGDGLLVLVDSGIDEGAHFWDSAWHDIDDDDFATAINCTATQARMIEYVRLPLIEKMHEVLAKRREEHQRHHESEG